MEYGILATLSILSILILFVLLDTFRIKNTNNIFYTLEYLKKKKTKSQGAQEETTDRDNIRKATVKIQRQESMKDRELMEAKKIETSSKTDLHTFQKIHQEERENISQQKTSSFEEIKRQAGIGFYEKKESYFDKSKEKREKTQRIEKKDLEEQKGSISPDRSQRISENSLRSNSISVENSGTEKQKFSPCKDTDRIEFLGQKGLPENVSQEEWQHVLNYQYGIVRENPSDFEQAIARIDYLQKELEKITSVLTPEDAYYNLLAEEKKKQSIPHSIDYGETSPFHKEKNTNMLSLSSYMDTDSSKLPKEKNEEQAHSPTIEKWIRMLKWKNA